MKFFSWPEFDEGGVVITTWFLSTQGQCLWHQGQKRTAK